MLDICSLNAGFIGGFSLKDITLHLKQGEHVGIVGESGSGKSLLSSLILGLGDSLGCRIFSGKISIEGEDLFAKSQKQLQSLRKKTLGYIPQNPLNALNPLHKIGKQLHEGLRLAFPLMPLKDRSQKILEYLDAAKLKDILLDRYPHELSGGQNQRILIVQNLLKEPKILICDEPTTALDSSVQKQILEFLFQITKEKNISVIFITHDLSIAHHFVENIIVMQEGRILEQQESKSLFENPKNAYTKSLLDALQLPIKECKKTKEVVLEVKDFGVFVRKSSFFTKKKIQLVDALDFCLHQKENLAILGESGSGKTSLGTAIMELMPSTGSKLLFGQSLHAREFYLQVQMVMQNPFASLNPRWRIGEILKEALSLRDATKERLEVKEALELVGLNEKFEDFYPHELSGGQNQRVAIARALLVWPKILILDEPTSGLDKNTQKKILSLLLDLQKNLDMAYIFITHDLDIVESFCDRVLMLQNGKKIFYDERDAFFSSKDSYIQDFLATRL